MSVDLRRPGLGDLRLGVPAACAWVTSAVVVGAPASSPVVFAVGAVVAVLTVVVLSIGGRACGEGGHSGADGPSRHGSVVAAVCTVLLLGSIAVCVVAAAVWSTDPRRSPAALDGVAARGEVRVTVRLDRDLAPADRSGTGVLIGVADAGVADGGVADGGGAEARGRWAGGSDVPVRVVPSRDDDAARTSIAAGTVVRAVAALRPDEPGSAVAFVAFVRGDVAVVAEPRGVLAVTDRARRAFGAVTERLPQPGGALLRGMAIGDRSGLHDGIESAMRTVSLTHLTAVSGSNCAVLVALVVMVGRACRMSRSVRVAVAVPVLLAFVVLVRPDPSIVRATVMAVTVLVVHLTGRPVRGIPVLAVAVIGMLVADPWYARSFAFGLSVLATAGLLVLAPPLAELLQRRLWTPVAAAVAVPIAAQAACWPLTILLAPVFPTFAVPANLLAEPLAPVATVIGLVACVLAPVWPGAASVVAAVAWAPAATVGAVAEAGAGLPWASLPWPDGVAGVLLAAVAVAVLVVALAVRGRVGVLLAIGGATVLVLVVVVLALPRAVVRGTVPSDWAIAMCDVGQGDALLLRSARATALVDTGDDPERLGACLGLLDVDRVDLLVLTHFDRDHVGAVDRVAGITDTALVGPTGRAQDEWVVRALTSAGADVRSATAGTSGRLGDLGWRALWPAAGADAGNAASVVLRVEPSGDGCARCLSAVLLGDLGAAAQRQLLRLGADDVAGADVVKVAHHGSKDQYPQLYRRIGADVGLIGVGANNYGHPTTDALRMLADAGTVPIRTDHSGTVALRRSDGRGDGGPGAGVDVWRERASSEVARRIGAAPPEGTHARQEARSRRGEDRPGPVVRDPPRAGGARHGPGDVPRRAVHRHAPRPARRGGPRARGP